MHHQVQSSQLRSSSSVHDEAWLQQCCTLLAEQLRIAQADNAELQVCLLPLLPPQLHWKRSCGSS